MLPFPAILGQEKAKKILLLNLISPRIGGVLLIGGRGTEKSTLARSLARLRPGTRIVNVPVGISEDRLHGGIDWEAAVKTGRRVFAPGLLAEADGHILYLDAVNRMEEKTVRAILDAAENGEVRLARDGLSLTYPCAFCLIASMDTEEGALSASISDRFGLCVTLDGVSDPGVRKEIGKRALACEDVPLEFQRAWRDQEEGLEKRIQESRMRMARIRIPAELLEAAAGLAVAKGCLGHRGEIALCRAAKALAAWSGRETVIPDDILYIAEAALDHRAAASENNHQPDKPATDKPTADNHRPENATESGSLPEKDFSGAAASHPGSGSPGGNSHSDGSSPSPAPLPEEMQPGILKGYAAPELPPPPSHREVAGGKSGRRHAFRSMLTGGRSLGHRLPRSRPLDIAWDATLKQALYFRASRPKGNLCVSILPEDIRIKKSQGKAGRILLFLVDASGSMGARKRMEAAKGCILASLKDAYPRRDRVALMAFRRKECRLILPLTRSPVLSERLLREIPVGGETPLGLGLTEALAFHRKIKGREPATPFHVLLFTDGRANCSLTGKNPLEEALDICAGAAKENISFSVVDTETGFVRLGLAHRMAERLNASYCRLQDLFLPSIPFQETNP